LIHPIILEWHPLWALPTLNVKQAFCSDVVHQIHPQLRQNISPAIVSTQLTARPYRSIDRRTSCFSDNVFISLRLEKLHSHVTYSTKAMHKDNTVRQTLICTPTVMRLAHEKPAQQAVILAVRGKKGGSNEMSHFSASEVTTIWRYTNVYIIIIIAVAETCVGHWWCCEISSVYSDGRSVRRGVHGCHLTSLLRQLEVRLDGHAIIMSLGDKRHQYATSIHTTFGPKIMIGSYRQGG